MNKQSKSIKYLKLDWRRKILGASFGFTTRSTDETLKLSSNSNVLLSPLSSGGKYPSNETCTSILSL
jgi:hypothetical protein